MTKNTRINKRIVVDDQDMCTESQWDILIKIDKGEYKLVKCDNRSSVWQVYREILRPDGSKLSCRYYCLGCRRVMQSIGRTTSNLRVHKCHVRYLKSNKLPTLRAASTSKQRREYEVNETDVDEDNYCENYLEMEQQQEESIELPELYKRRAKRFIWDTDATKMFLQLWAEHIEELRGSRTNTLVHKDMAQEMKDFGPSHIEIKAKMDNMSKKYRKEAYKFRATGTPSKWEYFYKLQTLLIGTSSVNVMEEVVLKSSDLASDEDEEDVYDNDIMQDDFDTILQDEDVENVNEDLPLKNEDVDLSTPDQSSIHIKRNRDDRLLEIEEQKLEIEKEKLRIMKNLSLQLSSFHKDIIKLLEQKKDGF